MKLFQGYFMSKHEDFINFMKEIYYNSLNLKFLRTGSNGMKEIKHAQTIMLHSLAEGSKL